MTRTRRKTGIRRGRPKQQSPIEAFHSNLADAELLLKLAAGFTNVRQKRLRAEMREKLGQALRVGKGRWATLDGIQSRSVFVVLLDPEHLSRRELTDQGPLLRAVVVAACAAFETYVADVAKRELSRLLKAKTPDNLPRRLREVPITVGDWVAIEEQYERRVWGLRARLEYWLEREASTSPLKVGQVLSAVGFDNWAAVVDRHRGVERGLTVRELTEVSERRNRIAHSLDRKGALTVAQVTLMLFSIRSIADALDVLRRGDSQATASSTRETRSK